MDIAKQYATLKIQLIYLCVFLNSFHRAHPLISTDLHSF